MYNPHDPRFRRTLNTVSQRLESANETAQISLFSLSENCLKPCFFSVSNCLNATTEFCIPSGLRDDRAGGIRRRRAPRQARGRLERSFDFYDDWEQDEDEALLAWENEENDRLLGTEADASGQPIRRGIMNYGTSGTDAIIRAIGGSGSGGNRKPQRRNTAEADPTVIPNSSFFGFLDRLPFKLGPRGTRYKPSAAGLVDRTRNAKGEEEEDEEERDSHQSKSNRRKRSDTVNSGHTEDSLSSRGDIFPSDDEVEDAIAFDDEYAARLVPDDSSSGKTRKARRNLKRVSSNSSHAHSSQPVSRRDSAHELSQSYSEAVVDARSPSKSSEEDLLEMAGSANQTESSPDKAPGDDSEATAGTTGISIPKEVEHDTTNK